MNLVLFFAIAAVVSMLLLAPFFQPEMVAADEQDSANSDRLLDLEELEEDFLSGKLSPQIYSELKQEILLALEQRSDNQAQGVVSPETAVDHE